MAASFDLLVLGAGSGGYACALRAAQLGLSVGLVEHDKVGGTCLHRGCIPTKAILHAAEVADAAREGAQFGIHATIDKIDLAGVQSYADGVVSRLYRGLSGLIASRSITVIPGEGRVVAGPDGRPAIAVADAGVRRAAAGARVRLVRPHPAGAGDRRPAHPDQRPGHRLWTGCRSRPSCWAAG